MPVLLICAMIHRQKVYNCQRIFTQNKKVVFFFKLINFTCFFNYLFFCCCWKFSEPKLTGAQRIVPEWKDYDAEIKNLLNRVQDQEHEEEEMIDNILSKSNSESKADGSNDEAKHTEL